MAKKKWSAADLRSRAEERLEARNQKIAELRERSGLSMDELAKLMGFKGQSGIQRYLSADYDKGFRPELAARFKAALIGRGNPPIHPIELTVFDAWPEASDGSTVDMAQMLYEHWESGEPRETFVGKLQDLGLSTKNPNMANILAGMQTIKAHDLKDKAIVGLPLLEGHVTLTMPVSISTESAEMLRNWLDHIVSLAVRDQPKK
jgi:hypothetical protein